MDRGTGTSNRPTVYAVIGVHNNVEYTLECLVAFEKQTYSPIQVIVVDDGSTDGTQEKVKERFSDTIVIRGDGNLWWTGAMRVGIERVLTLAKEGDYILSMNNDVVFDPDYVERLVGVSEKRGRALVGSRGIIRGTDQVSVQGGRFDWKHAWSNQSIDDLRDPSDPTILHKLDFLYGRGALFPIEVVKDVGNFDDQNFIQKRSDKEFVYRAAKAGYPVVICLECKVYVTETPETSSVAFSTRPIISYKQAWKVISHRNSSMHIPTGWKFIQMHCPDEYKGRNFAMFLLTAFDRSFGRTLPFYLIIAAYRRLVY